MKKFSILIFFASMSIIATSWADDLAPVVAATPTAVDGSYQNGDQTNSLSLDQRVTRLERQLNAMNQINLLSQVNNLQQQVQTLQGQVDLLTHNMKNLQNQLITQYADVDQRLQALGSKKTAKLISSVAAAGPTNNAANTIVSTDSSAASTAINNSLETNAADTTDVAPTTEQTVYHAAYSKIKTKDYPQAIAALQDFLLKYPNGHYAPSAYYWLGQLSLLQGNGLAAEKYFNTLIANYPSDSKVKDANLKLGFAYILENKMAKAKSQFKEVIRQYPNTPTAQMAQARLAQLS